MNIIHSRPATSIRFSMYLYLIFFIFNEKKRNCGTRRYFGCCDTRSSGTISRNVSIGISNQDTLDSFGFLLYVIVHLFNEWRAETVIETFRLSLVHSLPGVET